MLSPAPPDPASAPRRLDSLTGLRWWAAFGVFLHHMTNIAPLPAHSLLALGAQGVTFFFVLSGFVLTWSARPGVSATTFWWRRFARIWPLHMVALVIAVPVFHSPAPDPEMAWVKPFSLGVLLLSVLLLQGWSTSPGILFSGNPAAWTLSCEAFFYALHPALNRPLRRATVRGALLLAAGVVLGAGVFYLLRAEAPALRLDLVPQPVLRLWEFVLGMALGRAVQAGWRPRLKPVVGFGLLGLGAAAIWWVPRFGADLNGSDRFVRLVPVLIGVLCAVVIVAAVGHELRGGRSHLTSAPMVRLGEWSFAFYLLHATGIYLARGIAGGPAGTSWTNLAWHVPFLALSVLAAALAHHLVEKPVERRLRSAWDRRRAARATVTENQPAVEAITSTRREDSSA
ncbi:peptidoglycan/LPS O-acetylase OafA/YrhL [Georgenia soli]|uniref:Peptidoglycan/LPS O-acetylase OafA/YrhL n=1 Tax=Georgenia soli TaxID=638953 RepID=A0A2A9EJR0_9MICO|nr:acyltransferase [Georgenia soli]PFG38480.1 peptidoglycan/LPS O-acetylase OafA/YrhL [Georgenia soli]